MNKKIKLFGENLGNTTSIEDCYKIYEMLGIACVVNDGADITLMEEERM